MKNSGQGNAESVKRILKLFSIPELQSLFSKLQFNDSDITKIPEEKQVDFLFNEAESHKKTDDLALAAFRLYFEKVDRLSFPKTSIQISSSDSTIGLSMLRDRKGRRNEYAKKIDQILSAPLLVPEVKVDMVPEYQVNKLLEYSSDQTWTNLLIGLFGGAILGVLSNWATNENTVFTKASIFLILVFMILTSLFIGWSNRIAKRAKAVLSEIEKNKRAPSNENSTQERN